MSHPVHPLAELLPAMTDGEFSQLCESIKREGLLQPITLYDDHLLDGRHRLRACEETGVEPRYVTYSGDSPAAYVLGLNVERRHLSISQRAMLATAFLPELEAEARGRQVAHLKRGDEFPSAPIGADGRNKLNEPAHRAAADAAAAVGVGTKTVERAKRVITQRPDLAEQVRAGEMTVDAAERQIQKETAVPPTPTATEALTPRQIQRAEAHKRRLTEGLSSLEGQARGIASLDIDLIRNVMTAEELDEWSKSLARSLAAFRQLRADLQEGRH